MSLFRVLFFLTLVSVLSLSILPLSGFGEDEYYQALMFDESASREIDIISGDIHVIKVKGIKRVSVRDPEVADIQKAEAGEIIVAGKAQGATVLTVWTQTGKKQFRINVISEDLPALKKRLKEIIHRKLGIEEVVLKENKSSGKIMLLGNITRSERDRIEQVIAPFAGKIEDLLVTKKNQKMVEIDVEILELRKDDTDNLGINWLDEVAFTEAAPSASRSWQSLWQTGTWSRGNLNATLNLLIKEDKGRVLSRPKLLCLNGEEAKLLVGGEAPVLTEATTGGSGSSATSSASIEYKEYGIKLLIKPFILENQVYLSLTAEVSKLSDIGALTIQGTKLTAFTVRRAQTVVNVHSGDTVFLGGLIDSDDTDIVEEIPGFGKIPILGALFRSKEFTSDKTELVITLTPKIINLEKEKELKAKAKNKVEAKPQPAISRRRPLIAEDLYNYASGVKRKISRSVRYPRQLFGSGWAGRVVLSLEIDRYGELKSAEIEESSGYKVFDQDALNLVKNLTFYPFSAQSQREKINIEVPIVYRESH